MEKQKNKDGWLSPAKFCEPIFFSHKIDTETFDGPDATDLNQKFFEIMAREVVFWVNAEYRRAVFEFAVGAVCWYRRWVFLRNGLFGVVVSWNIMEHMLFFVM